MINWKLEHHQALDGIPGISSLAWTSDGLYALADNMPVLFRFDSDNLTLLERISLAEDGGLDELAKPIKPDYEASAIIDRDGRRELLMFGSGSVASTREVLARYDFSSGKVSRESLAGLYRAISEAETENPLEINIEGAATIGEELLLSNRGHIGQPHNHLARVHLTELNLLGMQRIVLPTEPFVGVSGLEYLADEDRLWFTASTEETSSVYDDGAIGDSYLGWVDDYSRKRDQAVIAPDGLINLNQLDNLFDGQKIEGLALDGDRLWLGADNDGGESLIFVLRRS